MLLIWIVIIVAIVMLLNENRKKQAEAEKKAAEEKRRQELQAAREKQEAERAEAEARKADWDAKHGRLFFAVAGVTFDNDDGTSRQKILRDVKARGSADAELSLEEYDYKGKPAVRILIDGECIGNVPRTRVDEVLAVLDRLESGRVDVETFRPEEEEDDDGNVRRRGELIYRADVTLVYSKS